MRLNVRCWVHGKTQTNRRGLGGQSPTGGGPSTRPPGVAYGPGRSAAGPGPADLGANGRGAGSRTGHGGPLADPLPAPRRGPSRHRSALGWPTPCPAQPRTRTGVHGRLERRGGARRVGGADAAAGRPGPTTGPAGEALGGVPPGPTAALAQSGPRHTTSQGRPAGAERVEKKRCPKTWRPC